MTQHSLKTWPEFYPDIESGAKAFEVRFDDRYFQVGDILWLREWDPDDEVYTGRSCCRTVAYLVDLDRFLPSDRGYVVLGLGELLMAERVKVEMLEALGLRS